MQYGISRHGLNGLLRRLPREVCDRLRPQLQRIDLVPGRVFAAESLKRSQIYFPRSGVVSMLRVLKNGDAGEIAMIGSDGMVGISLLVGGYNTTTREVVQIAGEAMAVDAVVVARELDRSREFRDLVLRYSQSVTSQMAQVMMCARHHSVEMQLGRWLLLSLDCIDGDVLNVTHETVAHALSVRREGVTEALGHLQQRGLVKIARGAIDVIDRHGLEQHGCECYQVVRGDYERLLMGPHAAGSVESRPRRSA